MNICIVAYANLKKGWEPPNLSRVVAVDSRLEGGICDTYTVSITHVSKAENDDENNSDGDEDEDEDAKEEVCKTSELVTGSIDSTQVRKESLTMMVLLLTTRRLQA